MRAAQHQARQWGAAVKGDQCLVKTVLLTAGQKESSLTCLGRLTLQHCGQISGCSMRQAV